MRWYSAVHWPQMRHTFFQMVTRMCLNTYIPNNRNYNLKSWGKNRMSLLSHLHFTQYLHISHSIFTFHPVYSHFTLTSCKFKTLPIRFHILYTVPWHGDQKQPNATKIIEKSNYTRRLTGFLNKYEHTQLTPLYKYLII